MVCIGICGVNVCVVCICTWYVEVYVVYMCVVHTVRRAWPPTPVFLPRESPWTEEPGQLQSWGGNESDTTE